MLARLWTAARTLRIADGPDEVHWMEGWVTLYGLHGGMGYMEGWVTGL